MVENAQNTITLINVSIYPKKCCMFCLISMTVTHFHAEAQLNFMKSIGLTLAIKPKLYFSSASFLIIIVTSPGVVKTELHRIPYFYSHETICNYRLEGPQQKTHILQLPYRSQPKVDTCEIHFFKGITLQHARPLTGIY